MKKLDGMVPSLSAFVLYLGADKNVNNTPPNSGVWYLPDYDIDKIYDLTVNGNIDDINWFLTRLSGDKKTFYMFVNVPFRDREYWKDNKHRLVDVFIKKMEHHIPNLSTHIVYKGAATPNTLYKWTLNYKGSTYGWAWTPSQYAVTGLTQKTGIDNLYITGHWTTLAHGVAGVAYVGRDTSMKIINKNLECT
jgi:prolycopene isomerase